MSVELWLPGGTAGLFLITQALGLSVWLTLAVVNNLQAFRSSVGAVGATMAWRHCTRLRPSTYPC